MLNNNHRRHPKVVTSNQLPFANTLTGRSPYNIIKKAAGASCYGPVQQLEGPESTAENHQKRISGTKLLSAEDIYEARCYSGAFRITFSPLKQEIAAFQPLD